MWFQHNGALDSCFTIWTGFFQFDELGKVVLQHDHLIFHVLNSICGGIVKSLVYVIPFESEDQFITRLQSLVQEVASGYMRIPTIVCQSLLHCCSARISYRHLLFWAIELPVLRLIYILTDCPYWEYESLNLNFDLYIILVFSARILGFTIFHSSASLLFILDRAFFDEIVCFSGSHFLNTLYVSLKNNYIFLPLFIQSRKQVSYVYRTSLSFVPLINLIIHVNTYAL